MPPIPNTRLRVPVPSAGSGLTGLRRILPSIPCLLSLLLFEAAALPSEPAAQYFGKAIRRIDYQSDTPLQRDRYDGVIGLKPGALLTHTALKAALQALYDSGRFSMIAAEVVPEESGIVLIFSLRLHYYFDTFRVEGKAPLRGRSPSAVITLPVGEHFSEEKLDEARKAVERYLIEQGYFQPQVGVRIERDLITRQVETTFEVNPGELATVRSVDIRGVPRGEDEVIRQKLGFKPGDKYRRNRMRRRMDKLKEYFVQRGFLAAVAVLSDTYQPSDHTVGLTLDVTNFGKVRVTAEGFKIERGRLRRLLPILSGEGIQPALLEEGQRNLKDFLDEEGFPETVVDVREEVDKQGIPVVRYTIDAGRKVTVADVRFEGNKSVPMADLLGVIQIQPARLLQRSVYSIAKLDSDVDSIRTLYNSRGFLDAEVIPLVKAVSGAERLEVTFVCQEGVLSTTRSLELNGNQGLTRETLQSRMELQPGRPYSPHGAERDRQALLAAYNDAGFLQARVVYHATKVEEKNEYVVAFDITEGLQTWVDSVLVLGKQHTRDSTIEKRIKLRPGEPLSLGKMLNTQQSLYNVGVFDRVRVNAQNPESVTAYQNVVVRLEESKRFTLRYGLGYQEREKVRGTVEFSNLNVLGTGQRADLRLRASSVEQLGILTFQQPQFRYLPVNSYFALSGQYKQELSFDERRYNLSYQYGRPVSGHSWALLRNTFNNVTVFNVTGEGPGREDSPRNLGTVSAIYINDTRDNYLDPEHGFFTSSDISLTTRWLGSNNYFSLFTQNNYYRKLTKSLLMATSLRFGLKQPYGRDTDIPISERFYAGGGSSLRGFETDRAGPLIPGTDSPEGGNALLIFNLEGRIPLFRVLHLAGFYDTGNVFSRLSDMSLSGFSHTVGFGLRFKTPFGPLRADYGFNLNLPPEFKADPVNFKTGHLFITIGPPF
jgi:outer membrane protein insertion porin family